MYTLFEKSKSKQIHKCGYLLCERIHHALEHFFKNYFKSLRQHARDPMVVKPTDPEKDKGMPVPFRHPLILLLRQVSELRWVLHFLVRK